MGTPYAVSSDLVSAYPAKSLAIAQYIDGYKLDTGPVQNAQTGTSYTFALTDTTKTVTANNAAASAYTVPPQSSVVWEAYTVLRLVNLGAGVVTLTAGAGVTLTGTVTVPQYGSVSIMRTASNAWTISGAGSAPGMELITPTSVVGGTLTGGQIAFATATEVSVNGCFTSAYENYRCLLSITATSAADPMLRMRFRAAGTNDSSSNYYSMFPTLVTSDYTQWRLGYASTTYADTAFTMFDIKKPQVSGARKSMLGQTISVSNAGTPDNVYMGAYALITTSFDGMSLLSSTGNISGTLRIYGYRNT